MKNNNIINIVKKDECTFCGTCEAVCPQNAIYHIKTKNNYLFKIKAEKCIDCGLCKKVCPGSGISYKKYTQELFKKTYSDEKESLLGIIEKCYFAYSKDDKLRYNASSGGSITSFLIFLLENKLIDGAIVCKSTDQNFESHGYIAKNKEQLVKSIGSKYIPVPLNIILKKIIKKKQGRYAFVGLPCHIHGLLKAQKQFLQLKENIFIKVGIICGQAVNFSGLEWFFKFNNINPGKVHNIKFRGEGWPGKVRIFQKDKKIFRCNLNDFFSLFTLGFFTPVRCLLCTDYLNDLADISFADAWHKDIMEKDRMGRNIIMTRTNFADKLLKQAKNYLLIEETNKNLIFKNYKNKLTTKKKCFAPKKYLAKIFGIQMPQYNIKYQSPGIFWLIITNLIFLMSILSNKLTSFFLLLPNLFWKIINKIHRILT